MKLKYTAICLFFLSLAILPELRAQQTLLIDKQEYSCAAAFNIAMRTKNIKSVIGLQGTVTWDTSVIKYSSISFGSSAITFNGSNVNVSDVQKGYLTFLWVESNLQGKSIADSTILFVIGFSITGTGKGKGSINFSNVPTALEIDTVDVNGFPVVNQNSVFVNGYIITPTVYNFTGSGNWDAPANWQDNILPPEILPTCSEIIINPSVAGECVLNTTQTILPGARLTVAAGKKFRIPANVQTQ